MALLVRSDDLRGALRHLDIAIDADPHLIDAIQLRALVRARLGEPSALDDVDRLLKIPTARRYYNAACAVAVYAVKAREQRQLPHALELLRRAVNLGFPAAEAVNDPDLAPLRSPARFRRLPARRRPDVDEPLISCPLRTSDERLLEAVLRAARRRRGRRGSARRRRPGRRRAGRRARQSSSTISRSWVAISLVQARPWISWMNRRRPRGSRLAVGSSSTRTEGSHARTPARQTRFRSPKLR